MRRLFLLVAAVVLVDTMFFAAVAPLLPHYSDDLGLSKSAAGVLAAAYPAGTLVGSLPAGWLAARVGVKPTVLLGLGLLAVTSVAFGFAQSVVVLDVARFAQGLGGACSWAGGLAWLVSASPAERRGTVIGSALGAAIVGVLLGPALGGLATDLEPGARVQRRGRGRLRPGRLGVDGARHPAGAERRACEPSDARLRRRAVLVGFWLFTLPAIFGGVIEVLARSGWTSSGASGALIGLIFLLVAGAEAVLSPVSGRLSDRHGRLAPIRVGLAGAVVMAALLPLPDTILLMAFALLATVSALGAFWAPAMALLSDAPRMRASTRRWRSAWPTWPGRSATWWEARAGRRWPTPPPTRCPTRCSAWRARSRWRAVLRVPRRAAAPS